MESFKGKNLIGQKFNRLTVLEYVGVENKRNTWKCKCDCGNPNYVYASTTDLLTNITKSCGCYFKEIMHKKLKKYNTYDLSGEYGIGITSNGYEFYFDLEDYDLIKDYCWWMNKDEYITSHDFNNNYLTINLHKFIMNEYNMVGDHWDGNPRNNRKENLRPTTSSQNSMNRKTNNNNTSGVKGVNWDKKSSKWISRIGINRKRITLGMFDNFEDAVKARIEAEQKYFGEYSYLNRPKGEII